MAADNLFEPLFFSKVHIHWLSNSPFCQTRDAFLRNLTRQLLAAPNIEEIVNSQRTPVDAKLCARTIGIGHVRTSGAVRRMPHHPGRCVQCGKSARSICNRCGRSCCPIHRREMKTCLCVHCSWVNWLYNAKCYITYNFIRHKKHKLKAKGPTKLSDNNIADNFHR